MAILTTKLIKQILGQASTDAKCSSCGNNEWLLPDEEPQFTVGLFTPRKDDGGYLMPGGIVPAVIVICKNCGLIRLHSKILLESLIPKNGEEGSSDGE